MVPGLLVCQHLGPEGPIPANLVTRWHEVGGESVLHKLHPEEPMLTNDVLHRLELACLASLQLLSIAVVSQNGGIPNIDSKIL